MDVYENLLFSGAQLLRQKKKSKSWAKGAIVERNFQEIDPRNESREGGEYKLVKTFQLSIYI